MDLILWRHAQAEDGSPDLERRLTSRGAKDAELVGGWLRKRIPDGAATVLCSPARRARQTADGLQMPYEVVESLAPGVSAGTAISAIGWPHGREGTVIVVGHNPWIGQAVARLVGDRDGPWPIRKAGFWWLSWREADGGGEGEVLVKAAMSPELLR
jgi:phosphohistidine phosphatase